MGRRLLDKLLPSPCLACGGVEPESPGDLGLCRRCRGRLVQHPWDACRGCGRPAPVLLDPGLQEDLQEDRNRKPHRCEACRRVRLPYQRLYVAWAYRAPLDATILGLKFRRLDYLADGLARGLAARIEEEGSLPFDAVIPVPLHWRRQLTRGYNQAHLIARPLARRLAVPVVRCLRRKAGSLPQSRQSRKERLRSLQGRFHCHRPQLVEGRRLLLVDDVVTTGATLHAAALELQRAGAQWVAAAAVARTPE